MHHFVNCSAFALTKLEYIYLKMKFIILFSTLLLVVFGVHATNLRRRANWPSVEENVSRLRELCYYTMYAIYTDANEDNVEVGEAIGRKVNEAAESGMYLLQIVQEEVDAKNLTVDLARLHLGQLLVVFTDLYSSIEPDLEGLSPPAGAKVDADFSYLFRQVALIASDIYFGLEEPDSLSCGILNFHNNETVMPLEPIFSDLLPGTEIWSEQIYDVEYAAILLHPHNKYLDSEITNSTLWFKTTNDYPNFLQETNFTSVHRVLIFHCTDGSNVMYEFEFPIEEGPIIEPTLPPE